MKNYAYRILLQPEPEGGFTVTVPSLPGVVTWGENFEHALAMAEEAIQCMIESLVADGEQVPQEIDDIREIAIRVAVPSA